MNTRLWLSLTPCAAAIGLGMALPSMPNGKPDRAILDVHEDSAAASLTGQFRTNAAAWLWLHTDLYLHNGVEMRPLVKGEDKQAESAAIDEHDLKEAPIVTSIPPPQFDFRGLLGDLERETAAYKSMSGHRHRDPSVALPLFRLMCWIDPNFIPGWTNGAATMARNRSAFGTDNALAFLSEGRAANPSNIEIESQFAALLISRKHDLRGGSSVLYPAIGAALKQFDRLSAAEREALQDGFRWLTIAEREQGHTPQANRVAAAGLKLFPDDGVLKHELARKPSILNPKGPNLAKP